MRLVSAALNIRMCGTHLVDCLGKIRKCDLIGGGVSLGMSLKFPVLIKPILYLFVSNW